MIEKKDRDTIEAMIDRQNVHYVLDAIIQVMNEKAEHIRTNYQDDALSRAWESSAKTIQKCADKFA